MDAFGCRSRCPLPAVSRLSIAHSIPKPLRFLSARHPIKAHCGTRPCEWPPSPSKGCVLCTPFAPPLVQCSNAVAPLPHVSSIDLFRYLSIDNILLLYGAVALERRILFVSSDLRRLCRAADAVCHLLLPLFWRHIFIPVLPQALTDFISAPMPFIVGVHSSYMPDELLLDAVVVVELDSNVIKCTETDPIEPLPDKRYETMSKALRKCAGGADTSLPLTADAAKALDEEALLDVFLKTHAKLLHRYRDYLEAPSELVVDKFDKAKVRPPHTLISPLPLTH
jgi:hypothetical protein